MLRAADDSGRLYLLHEEVRMFGMGIAPDDNYEDPAAGDLGLRIMTGIYNLEVQGTPNRWMQRQAPDTFSKMLAEWISSRRYAR